jgi:hypothetical protein
MATIDEKLVALRREHPEYPQTKVAEVLGVTRSYVSIVAGRNNIGWREFRAAQPEPKAHDLHDTSGLVEWQDRVIKIARAFERRLRKNKEQRLEAGQLLWKIHDEMLKADPAATKYGHPIGFWNWVTKTAGIHRSLASAWMRLAKHGLDNSTQPSIQRIRYWAKFDKRMRVAVSVSEKVALLIEAVDHLQRQYEIPTRCIKLASERAA